jgi:endoglucanase
MNAQHALAIAITIAAMPACYPVPAGGGAVAAVSGGESGGLSKCADGLVDDGEDGDHKVADKGGRGGYWYTYVDKAGSTVTPTAGEAGGTFAMSDGGAGGSKKAARMSGAIGKGNVVFAGMGFGFTDPKGAYDLSRFKAIRFKAKIGEGSTPLVRVKVPDGNTDPDGKACKECFNDFGAELTLTGAWETYTLPFAGLRQQAGWGSPRPASIDASHVYGLQWQASTPGAKFDVWVDDVELVGCE